MLALALERFAAEGVTLAVVEAGVGARRDATSALRTVVASVVTNVALDHVETLGATLEEIARDKSAAARPGTPLVTAARGVALDVLRAAAHAAGSPFTALADDPTPFALPAGYQARGAPETHLENLRVACATARVLAFGEDAIAAGCLAPRPPARFERFRIDDTDVILDGAHDPAAAAALAAAAPNAFVLVFGALARKQGAATLAPLARAATWTIVTGADADEGAGTWPASEHVDDPATALERALQRAGPGGTVVVAGSLYLAGRLRPTLERLAARGRTAIVADG
jgi:dihydrofolate synthase / folylpolyglutamate synthase